MVNPIIIIPARLASQRLPDKPLALIEGEAMIVHVWRRAMEAELGPVLVAAGDEPIVEVIEKAGGQAVLTDPELASGSDRVAAALDDFDPEKSHDVVVNLQGDLPTLEPEAIRRTVSVLAQGQADIATLGAVITDPDEVNRPSVVKAVVEMAPGARSGRALYFSRTPVPHGEGPLIHHIGIYAYRRPALEGFVALPPSALEQREKLEQLRALTAGMHIDMAMVDTVPLGVDTPADLEVARKELSRSEPSR
ncbi:MAG: 3-deoxy-manno-octulosonate cytidylyltransferase [Pseudomonadota bacterium]